MRYCQKAHSHEFDKLERKLAGMAWPSKGDPATPEKIFAKLQDSGSQNPNINFQGFYRSVWWRYPRCLGMADNEKTIRTAMSGGGCWVLVCTCTLKIGWVGKQRLSDGAMLSLWSTVVTYHHRRRAGIRTTKKNKEKLFLISWIWFCHGLAVYLSIPEWFMHSISHTLLAKNQPPPKQLEEHKHPHRRGEFGTMWTMLGQIIAYHHQGDGQALSTSKKNREFLSNPQGRDW